MVLSSSECQNTPVLSYKCLLDIVTICSELEREKRQIRLQMLPFIQAEKDLEYVKAVERTRRLEAIATADDPNWIPGQSSYNTKNVPISVILDEKGELRSM